MQNIFEYYSNVVFRGKYLNANLWLSWSISVGHILAFQITVNYLGPRVEPCWNITLFCITLYIFFLQVGLFSFVCTVYLSQLEGSCQCHPFSWVCVPSSPISSSSPPNRKHCAWGPAQSLTSVSSPCVSSRASRCNRSCVRSTPTSTAWTPCQTRWEITPTLLLITDPKSALHWPLVLWSTQVGNNFLVHL